MKIVFWLFFIYLTIQKQLLRKNRKYKGKTKSRSSRPEVFCKKVFLEFRKIHRKTPVPESPF